tara:strand:+ start:1134 stop:1397 length:264 start_codon:yes stop_codon:yes gene_type:complete
MSTEEKDCNCNKAPTVDMHIGFTFRVGDLSTNQYARTDISYNGLDTSLPMAPQIENCREASDMAFPDMREFIAGQINEILDSKESKK